MKNKNQLPFMYYELINKKLFLLLLIVILFIALKSNAQTVSSPKNIDEVEVVSDELNNKMNIEFSTEKEIYNLLVLITDSLGQTVFLDNRYRFKGDYKHSIDFKNYNKGPYSIKIIGDNEKIIKKVDVK